MSSHPKAIATVGPSASGKSTWCAAFIAERASAGERWVEINKDELRKDRLREAGLPEAQLPSALKLWDYDPAGSSEKELSRSLEDRLSQAISGGADGVVFSNTNMDGGMKARGQWVASGGDPSRFERKLFLVDFNECLRRDQARVFSVGRKVLEFQFSKLSELGVGFSEAPVAPTSKPLSAQ